VREEGEPLRLPGERVLPFLACGAIVWVLSSATGPELGVTAIVVSLASLLYAVRRRASGRHPAGAAAVE
jgi:uncharacterized RDD family membrane protein YckC